MIGRATQQQNQRDVKEANKLSKSSWLQNFG
jgi:hypothetical protein